MISSWEGRRVLITGHTGFKGAWLALWLQRLGATVVGLSLPAEDLRGAYQSFAPWSDIEEHILDIRSEETTKVAVVKSAPDVVFHLAAQSLVRRGYREPAATYATNVLGTVNVLEALGSLRHVPVTVVVTSDKVYANDGTNQVFGESDRLGGVDPYSASKACAELVASSFRSRKGVPVSTARAGNVLGGGDRGEDRLLPDLHRSVEVARPISVRNPGATRPWQFVLDPLWGYLLLADSLVEHPTETPHSVNFGPGPNACVPVDELLERACRELGKGSWEFDTGVHPHEAPALRLDASLASETLGWEPRVDLDSAIRWTVAWWKAEADGSDLRRLACLQMEQYLALGEQ